MEVVVNSDVETSDLVDVPHDFLEFLAVTALCKAGAGIGEKEESVNHFVEKSFFELVGSAVLQQWRREFDGA